VKVLPIALAANLASKASTPAYALRVTRQDGQVFGFTSAGRPATISGVSYSAAQGLDASAIATSAGLNVDNLELTTLDDGSLFTKADLRAGVWQGAAFLVFRYSWANPADGIEPIIAGTFGNVTSAAGAIRIELRGLQQYLQQPVGSITTKTCRARFADFPAPNGNNRCTLVAAAWTDQYTVATVASRREFTADSFVTPGGDALYSQVGLLLLCNGANNSAAITDSGPLAITTSPQGDAKLTTAQQRFGTASLALDGSGDYVVVPDAAGINIASGDFTLELSFRLTSATTCVMWNKGAGTGYFQAQLWYDAGTGKLGFRAYDNGGTPSMVVNLRASVVVALNTWVDAAVVRSGNTFTLYQNGASVASSTHTGVLFSTAATASVGAYNNGTAPVPGQIDHVRLTKAARSISALSAEFEAYQAEVAVSQPDDWFADGIVTWVTGANAGQKMKAKAFTASGNAFTLMTDMAHDIEVGDRFAALAGCRHRLDEDCAAKFDNAINFQAEPHLPGLDALTASPASAG
jgi:uncharacterized phage protein (TIGR02218 family)